MGLSVAWQLHKKGHDISLYDQNIIPNPISTSYDQSRVIRYGYGESLGYTAMAKEAHFAWQGLWDDLEKCFFIPKKSLFIGDQQGKKWIDNAALCLKKINSSYQYLTKKEISNHYPLITPRDQQHFLLADEGGLLLAKDILLSLYHYLKSKNVKFYPGTKIKNIKADQNAISITAGEYIKADALIIAAGPWVNQLIPTMQSKIIPSRQNVVYLQAQKTQKIWKNMPVIAFMDKGFPIYAIPPTNTTDMKIASHNFSLKGHPDECRDLKITEINNLKSLAQQRFENFDDLTPIHAHACYYTVRDKEQFLIDKIGDNQTYIMTGFSGHGFKFGPLLGTAMAQLLEGKKNLQDIQKWATGDEKYLSYILSPQSSFAN